MTSTTTYVTCFVQIYDQEPNEHKGGIEWRLQRFRELANTGIYIIIYGDEYTIPILQQTILKEYPDTVKLDDSFHYRTSGVIYNIIYKQQHTEQIHEIIHMPSERNEKKDTMEYMALMNSKIEFVYQAMQWNPFATDYFAWIDFSISYILKHPQDTLHRLKEPVFPPIGEHIVFPGCPAQYENTPIGHLFHRICWLFLGGFFYGHKIAIEHFYELSVQEFARFLETYHTLVWEVNFWAYLYLEKEWRPNIYEADHDDSMIKGFSI